MAIIKSDSTDLTINADGASSSLKLQINGVEKASISSAGFLTSTTIDATKLTGTIPSASYTDTDTTYAVGDGGLTQVSFTTADNTKLDGIATSANNYTHPTTAGDKHIPTGGAADQVLTYDSSGTAVWADAGGGGGKVLQMVHTTFRGTVTTMSSSWTALPDNLSITPQSTTSKLFVTVRGGPVFFRDAQFGWQIFRDGSQTVGTSDDWQGYVHNSASNNVVIPVSFSCTVTSGSLSATNFKVYTKGSGSYANWSDSGTYERQFTIMEVEV